MMSLRSILCQARRLLDLWDRHKVGVTRYEAHFESNKRSSNSPKVDSGRSLSSVAVLKDPGSDILSELYRTVYVASLENRSNQDHLHQARWWQDSILVDHEAKMPSSPYGPSLHFAMSSVVHIRGAAEESERL